MAVSYKAFDGERLVCVDARDRTKRWRIWWVGRQWASERIHNLTAAKAWIAQIMRGHTIVWVKEQEE